MKKKLGKPLNKLLAFTWVEWDSLNFLSLLFREAIKAQDDGMLSFNYNVSYPMAVEALKIPYRDIPLHLNDHPSSGLFKELLGYRLEKGI